MMLGMENGLHQILFVPVSTMSPQLVVGCAMRLC